MKNLISKAAAIKFLKKVIIFCFGYIIVFTVAMIVIYCIKGDYPETLATLTFAYFGIEIVISAMIKIFDPFQKNKPEEYPLPIEEENYVRHNPDNQ